MFSLRPIPLSPSSKKPTTPVRKPLRIPTFFLPGPSRALPTGHREVSYILFLVLFVFSFSLLATDAFFSFHSFQLPPPPDPTQFKRFNMGIQSVAHWGTHAARNILPFLFFPPLPEFRPPFPVCQLHLFSFSGKLMR